MKNYLGKKKSQRSRRAIANQGSWYSDTALMGALFNGGTASFSLIAGDGRLVNQHRELSHSSN